MKQFLYVVGLGSEDGISHIRPVFANSEGDAFVEYGKTILSDARVILDGGILPVGWIENGFLFEDVWVRPAFLSITKDMFDKDTSKRLGIK